MIAGSAFNSCFDVEPVAFQMDWCEFAEWLEIESHEPAKPADKERTMCVTPCVYAEGTTRKKANAQSWNWFAADIDNKSGNQPHSTIEAVAEKVLEHNVPFIIYSTTSSRMDKQCFRLMFPLKRMVDFDRFPSLWSSASQWLGCLDEGTKDISRLFVAPRQWEGSEPFFFSHLEGEPLDPEMLMFLYPPLEEVRIPRARVRTFADTTGLKPVTPDQISLHGEFVTDRALTRAQTGEQGKRMFGFLVSVGTTAMLKGYAISADDLADIGYELAGTLKRHTGDIDHDAENAFERALERYAELKAERFDRFSKTNATAAYLAKWGKK